MVSFRKFGELGGRDVTEAVLEDGNTRLAILNYGCVTRDWRIGDLSIVLGFDAFDDYPAHSKSFGIIAGRVANRTALGRFELDGTHYQLATGNGPHHLHGGVTGLGRRIWDMEADSAANAVRLTYHSADGEEGYPGAVDFEVEIALSGCDVTYSMAASADRPTPVNLAQHNYYNLTGREDIRDHALRLAASSYTEVDADLIPTGRLLPVAGSHLDFRKKAVIRDLDPSGMGIDLNLVLDEDRDTNRPAAELSAPDNGLTLRMWTDQPGVQVYNAPQMRVPVPGLGSKPYGPFAGICLEAQGWPDALNHKNFPSIVIDPDSPYRQTLRISVS